MLTFSVACGAVVLFTCEISFFGVPMWKQNSKTCRHFVLLEEHIFSEIEGANQIAWKTIFILKISGSTFSQNFWIVVDRFEILICTKWFVCTFKNRFNSYNPGQNYVLGTSGKWRCVLTLLARIVDKFRYYLIYFLSQFWLAVKPPRQLQITSHSGEWRLSPEFSRKGKSVCTQATNNRL